MYWCVVVWERGERESERSSLNTDSERGGTIGARRSLACAKMCFANFSLSRNSRKKERRENYRGKKSQDVPHLTQTRSKTHTFTHTRKRKIEKDETHFRPNVNALCFAQLWRGQTNWRKERKEKNEKVFGDSWRFRFERVCVSVCVSSEYRTNIGTNGGTGWFTLKRHFFLCLLNEDNSRRYTTPEVLLRLLPLLT